VEDFIDVNGVSFKYDQDDVTSGALYNINLRIKKGEFVSIIGHNGSGKSTLAKHFNAMLLPSEGHILVDNLDTKDESKKYEIRCKVGLVLQNPDNQIVASIVEEDVAFAPENMGLPPEEIRKRVDKALKAVGMYKLRKSATFKLSGGQKQRVAIAGIIAMLPEYIVLDEPTAMLDPRSRDEVLETIISLRKNLGITIILITHFMEEAILADRLILMNRGKVALDDSPRRVFERVDILQKCKISLPQCMQLICELRNRGFHIPKNVLNEDECVSAIERILEGNNCT
jgi:energy-coupling factor transport system ATP-binding protein